ncbi:PQ loop repeat containing, isoform CRA_c, partial [Mus musculus]
MEGPGAQQTQGREHPEPSQLRAGFLVFLRYQHYYGNPLLTYLEYPILIAQASLTLHGRICVFLVHPQPAEMDHRLGH